MSDRAQEPHSILETALQRFAPSLVKHFGPKPRDWARIEKKIIARMSRTEAELAVHSSWQVATTTWELVGLAHEGNQVERDFLRFIDGLADKLAQVTPPELLPSAREQFRNLFLDFSDTESSYLDKVGELAATHYFLACTGARPLGFEVKVIPGRENTFDLLVQLGDGSERPVEVLNVHFKDGLLSDEAGLHTFLDGRVEQKVCKKTGKGLDAGIPPFELLLVLWCNIEILRQFAEAIMSRAHGFELPACALIQLRDENGRKGWDFGSVAKFARRPGFV